MSGVDWEDLYVKSVPRRRWEKGGRASPGLVDFLVSENRSVARVLVPGCGFGHDVRALAATAGEVVGLDLAPFGGRGRRRRFPVVGAERYVQGGPFCPVPRSSAAASTGSLSTRAFARIQPAQRPAYVEARRRCACCPGWQAPLARVLSSTPATSSPDEGPPFEVSVAELDRFFLPRF